MNQIHVAVARLGIDSVDWMPVLCGTGSGLVGVMLAYRFADWRERCSGWNGYGFDTREHAERAGRGFMEFLPVILETADLCRARAA